jgi:hypothetical protein
MVSILLLRVFARESPVSEKMLRLYSRITEECLSSEHANGKFRFVDESRNSLFASSSILQFYRSEPDHMGPIEGGRQRIVPSLKGMQYSFQTLALFVRNHYFLLIS